MSTLRRKNMEIIRAYQQTGSVWEAGKLLGISGQHVQRRLRAVSFPLAGQHWTDKETAELRSLVEHVGIAEIAERLGRPYAGVACKISELGIGVRYGNRNGHAKKLPRGAGYDKASVDKYRKQITASQTTVHRFARANGLGVEMLCQALERHFPEWWQEYRRTHSDLPETDCPYCGTTFVPSTKKQVYCSRKCSSDRRTDDTYFGGKRRQTIGLAEGECQLCLRVDVKGLSSHHVLGKENDPENDVLVALCQGCHQIIGHLGGRTFTDDPSAWERLIQFVWMRRHGQEISADAGATMAGVSTCVEIKTLSAEYFDEDDVA